MLCVRWQTDKDDRVLIGKGLGNNHWIATKPCDERLRECGKHVDLRGSETGVWGTWWKLVRSGCCGLGRVWTVVRCEPSWTLICFPILYMLDTRKPGFEDGNDVCRVIFYSLAWGYMSWRDINQWWCLSWNVEFDANSDLWPEHFGQRCHPSFELPFHRCSYTARSCLAHCR